MRSLEPQAPVATAPASQASPSTAQGPTPSRPAEPGLDDILRSIEASYGEVSRPAADASSAGRADAPYGERPAQAAPPERVVLDPQSERVLARAFGESAASLRDKLSAEELRALVRHQHKIQTDLDAIAGKNGNGQRGDSGVRPDAAERRNGANPQTPASGPAGSPTEALRSAADAFVRALPDFELMEPKQREAARDAALALIQQSQAHSAGEARQLRGLVESLGGTLDVLLESTVRQQLGERFPQLADPLKFAAIQEEAQLQLGTVTSGTPLEKLTRAFEKAATLLYGHEQKAAAASQRRLEDDRRNLGQPTPPSGSSGGGAQAGEDTETQMLREIERAVLTRESFPLGPPRL